MTLSMTVHIVEFMKLIIFEISKKNLHSLAKAVLHTQCKTIKYYLQGSFAKVYISVLFIFLNHVFSFVALKGMSIKQVLVCFDHNLSFCK